MMEDYWKLIFVDVIELIDIFIFITTFDVIVHVPYNEIVGYDI